MPLYENGRGLPDQPRRRGVPPRLRVILQVYLDESGTHAESENIILAGYAASEDQWRRFEPAWDNMLTRNGVTILHGTELKSGKDRCKHLSLRQRTGLVSNAEEIANHYLGFRVGVQMRKQDFKKVVFRFRQTKFHDSMYGLLFRTIVSSMRIIGGRHYPQCERIDYFIEDGHKNVGDAVRIFKDLKRELPFLGDLTIGSKDTLALQVADFMALAMMIEANGKLVDWSESIKLTDDPPEQEGADFPTMRLRLDEPALRQMAAQLEARKEARKAHYLSRVSSARPR